jgi:hypothetical protein
MTRLGNNQDSLLDQVVKLVDSGIPLPTLLYEMEIELLRRFAAMPISTREVGRRVGLAPGSVHDKLTKYNLRPLGTRLKNGRLIQTRNLLNG